MKPDVPLPSPRFHSQTLSLQGQLTYRVPIIRWPGLGGSHQFRSFTPALGVPENSKLAKPVGGTIFLLICSFNEK